MSRRMLMALLLALIMRGCTSVPVFAQAAKTIPAPALSASERIALQSIEEKKQGIKQQWNALIQQESQVIAEFAQEHPGWHLDPMTFAPAKDALKPKESKEDEKKVSPEGPK